MTSTVLSAGAPAPAEKVSKTLFITCFTALIATSFGFIIRANIIGELGVHFNLSETQKGEILGVGVLGAVFLGNIQDRQIDRELLTSQPAIHARIAAAEKSSVFGSYKPID